MAANFIQSLVRPHLLGLVPYSSARDDFQGEATVFLDANENPFENSLNRYPDPHQREVKNKISEIKNIPAENIFIGNGSDEVIDLLQRTFCEPGKDNIVITPPTYGMYAVSARINNIEVRKSLLNNQFQLDVDAVLNSTDKNTKLIFLCSPNNPTGNHLYRSDIKKIISEFKGLIVVDEAYIDFSDQESLFHWTSEFPNLIIMQTLSKAWGLAGIRMGFCFANRAIIDLLDRIKPPYNVGSPNQREALHALNAIDSFKTQVENIKSERQWLTEALVNISSIKKIYPSDGNFLLVKTTDADAIYKFLTAAGVIVRNRSKEPGCENCLRITIGTKEENTYLIQKLIEYV